MHPESVVEAEKKMLEHVAGTGHAEPELRSDVGTKRLKKLFLKSRRPAPRYKEGEIVEVAETKYRVQRDGWRRIDG